MNPILKASILCACAIFSHAISHAQGAWNINYLPVKSIDSTFIGKEVRLDFRRNSSDTLTGPIKPFEARKLLSTSDTVKLEIGKDSMRFVETWKIYVDHGVVSEQFLQCIEEGQSEVWIKELYLKSVTRLFFTFDAV